MPTIPLDLATDAEWLLYCTLMRNSEYIIQSEDNTLQVLRMKSNCLFPS